MYEVDLAYNGQMLLETLKTFSKITEIPDEVMKISESDEVFSKPEEYFHEIQPYFDDKFTKNFYHDTDVIRTLEGCNQFYKIPGFYNFMYYFDKPHCNAIKLEAFMTKTKIVELMAKNIINFLNGEYSVDPLICFLATVVFNKLIKKIENRREIINTEKIEAIVNDVIDCRKYSNEKARSFASKVQAISNQSKRMKMIIKNTQKYLPTIDLSDLNLRTNFKNHLTESLKKYKKDLDEEIFWRQYWNTVFLLHQIVENMETQCPFLLELSWNIESPLPLPYELYLRVFTLDTNDENGKKYCFNKDVHTVLVLWNHLTEQQRQFVFAPEETADEEHIYKIKKVSTVAKFCKTHKIEVKMVACRKYEGSRDFYPLMESPRNRVCILAYNAFKMFYEMFFVDYQLINRLPAKEIRHFYNAMLEMYKYFKSEEECIYFIDYAKFKRDIDYARTQIAPFCQNLSKFEEEMQKNPLKQYSSEEFWNLVDLDEVSKKFNVVRKVVMQHFPKSQPGATLSAEKLMKLYGKMMKFSFLLEYPNMVIFLHRQQKCEDFVNCCLQIPEKGKKNKKCQNLPGFEEVMTNIAVEYFGAERDIEANCIELCKKYPGTSFSVDERNRVEEELSVKTAETNSVLVTKPVEMPAAPVASIARPVTLPGAYLGSMPVAKPLVAPAAPMSECLATLEAYLKALTDTNPVEPTTVRVEMPAEPVTEPVESTVMSVERLMAKAVKSLSKPPKSMIAKTMEEHAKAVAKYAESPAKPAEQKAANPMNFLESLPVPKPLEFPPINSIRHVETISTPAKQNVGPVMPTATLVLSTKTPVHSSTTPVQSNAGPVQPTATPVLQTAPPPVQQIATLVLPTTTSVQPSATPVQPNAGHVKPTGTHVQLDRGCSVQPSATLVLPTTTPVQLNARHVRPPATPAQPAATPAQPDAKPVQPNAKRAKSKKSKKSTVHPTTASVLSNAGHLQPTAQPVKSNAGPAQPTATSVLSNAQPVQPTATPVQLNTVHVQQTAQHVQQNAGGPIQSTTTSIETNVTKPAGFHFTFPVVKPVAIYPNPVGPTATPVKFPVTFPVATDGGLCTRPMEPTAPATNPMMYPVTSQVVYPPPNPMVYPVGNPVESSPDKAKQALYDERMTEFRQGLLKLRNDQKEKKENDEQNKFMQIFGNAEKTLSSKADANLIVLLKSRIQILETRMHEKNVELDGKNEESKDLTIYITDLSMVLGEERKKNEELAEKLKKEKKEMEQIKKMLKKKDEEIENLKIRNDEKEKEKKKRDRMIEEGAEEMIKYLKGFKTRLQQDD